MGLSLFYVCRNGVRFYDFPFDFASGCGRCRGLPHTTHKKTNKKGSLVYLIFSYEYILLSVISSGDKYVLQV